MRFSHLAPPSRRGAVLAASLLVILLLAASLQSGSGRHVVAQARAATVAMHDHGAMTAEAMQRWVSAFYATHPARIVQSTVAPSDSFLASGFTFDENGDGSVTQVDTARIFTGQSILWRLVSGSHTVTSGTGSTDPNVGQMFDVPLSTLGGVTVFTFQYNSAGTYPFFCRTHESFNMRGVVVVRSAASVDPVGGRAGAIGFLAPPSPNPTRGTSSFRFALSAAGHARAQVFDVRGRRVATVLDRDLAAGSWAAAWDGRAAGRRADPGVYFLRLEVPGRAETRTIVVAR